MNQIDRQNIDIEKELRTANSRFDKAVVLFFYESEALHSSFVHLMKFNANNSPLRLPAKP